ncbi:MAG: sigma-70 family RNA polymerase sigma factor [Alphaproteobacteria bacterium]|nr:sigma-70 family RNA polymerase sigma factor [Alphaproteobacteria bacterium]
MQRTAAGDREAFRLLAHELSARMYGLAFRLMRGNKASAEDAVQDTLIKLWVHAPKWQPRGSVESYVSRLIYTCCIDIMRKQKAIADIDALPEAALAADEDIESAFAQKEQNLKLLEAVETLPPKQKEALMLSYYGEHTNKTVASMLNISEKAVEKLLQRARHKLAEKMGGAAPQGSNKHGDIAGGVA